MAYAVSQSSFDSSNLPQQPWTSYDFRQAIRNHTSEAEIIQNIERSLDVNGELIEEAFREDWPQPIFEALVKKYTQNPDGRYYRANDLVNRTLYKVEGKKCSEAVAIQLIDFLKVGNPLSITELRNALIHNCSEKLALKILEITNTHDGMRYIEPAMDPHHPDTVVLAILAKITAVDIEPSILDRALYLPRSATVVEKILELKTFHITYDLMERALDESSEEVIRLMLDATDAPLIKPGFTEIESFERLMVSGFKRGLSDALLNDFFNINDTIANHYNGVTLAQLRQRLNPPPQGICVIL